MNKNNREYEALSQTNSGSNTQLRKESDKLASNVCYQNSGEHISLITADRQTDGLGVWSAMVFLVAELAGSGVLALPLALANIGYGGIAVMVLSAVMSAISGTLLSKCWLVMRERNPEKFTGGQLNSAYPTIGEYAWGKPMRYFVSAFINLTAFGVCTVFLLMAAQNIQSLLDLAKVHFSFCFILIILAVFLVPFTWAGSPKDFPGIGLCASVATGIAIVIILASMIRDKTEHPDRKVTIDTPTFESFFLGFGAILFSFGGVGLFPTIQQDMQEPAKFPFVSYLSFAVLLAMYLPVSAMAFFLYGDKLTANILQQLPSDWLRATAEAILTLHLLAAFIIIINPWSQDVESVLKIPPTFGWRRCLARTLLVGVCLFTAESVPQFGGLLDFIGGASVTTLNFVLPCVLYLRICSREGDWHAHKIPAWHKVLCMFIIVLGIGGGAVSTFSSLKELTSPSTFVPPCYINMTAAEGF